jgi:N-acetylglutamate synthase-like GNAT family acetyltransferase
MNNVEARHDFSSADASWVEERLYAYNRKATGHGDGEGLAFVMRDDEGRLIAVAAGYSWGGIAELRQMWVDENYRGQGHARVLLEAFIAESLKRGVKRIFVASYDFQAPKMYEKFGFKRVAEFAGWPEGHTNVLLCKEFGGS